MTEISGKSRAAAARAARAYLSGQGPTRTTRANPAPSRAYTAAEIAQLHHTSLPLMKKYILLLRAKKPLPNETKKKKGRSPPALSEAKEKALYTFIQSVEKSVFAITEAFISNYTSFIRKHRNSGPMTPVLKTWVRRFKTQHPELQYKTPKIKEITRLNAELNFKKI
ncbi:hypothetical protein BGZ63DRAFT_387967, partial [Mariannaea sp. PMI_226]